MAFPSTYTADTVNQLAAALNAQRATSGATWEGGLGADKSALYMADELAKSGITDLSQVAQGNGNIINKVTGQPLYSGYGERTGGNIWSGSYEGGGNTGFGVNFDDKGNPIFFTQGASSSTLNDDLLKAAALAAAAYGGYSLMGGESLFGGALGGAGTGATAGMTAAELAQLDLALGGAGGTLGAETLGAALTTGATVPTLTNLTGGSGAATAGATGASALSSLTPTQIANLAKAGINVAGLLGGANAISNMGGNNTATPITYSGGGAGGYSPDYFSQVQSNYNSLMPGVPRDVASPLQNWYSTEFNPGASVTGSLFGDMTGGTAAGSMRPTTLKPVTTPIVKPVTGGTTTTTIVGGNGNDTVVGGGNGGGGNDTVVNPGSAGYQYATTQLGQTPAEYLNSINQWIIDNPRATKEQQDAALAAAGVSQTDLQEALRTTTFSDATKYALTHGGSLRELGDTIVDWINANPTATNEQIQAEQAKYGISDQDIANALYGLNSSAGKEYAVVQDMGLNQYYKNIADAAQSGISVADAVAQMQQYGVSPADVRQAYSMFAPAGGLTLDEVLAAYNK